MSGRLLALWILVMVGVVCAFARIIKSSAARDGIVWAIQSWLAPPDSDAGWQQGPG